MRTHISRCPCSVWKTWLRHHLWRQGSLFSKVWYWFNNDLIMSISLLTCWNWYNFVADEMLWWQLHTWWRWCKFKHWSLWPSKGGMGSEALVLSLSGQSNFLYIKSTTYQMLGVTTITQDIFRMFFITMKSRSLLIIWCQYLIWFSTTNCQKWQTS